jgi:hypothetical protein
LRRLISGTGLAIEYDEVGYRLQVPNGFVYIEDVDAPPHSV